MFSQLTCALVCSVQPVSLVLAEVKALCYFNMHSWPSPLSQLCFFSKSDQRLLKHRVQFRVLDKVVASGGSK